jgi:hypothetical protein
LRATTGRTTYIRDVKFETTEEYHILLTSSQFEFSTGCIQTGIACSISSPSGVGYTAIDRRFFSSSSFARLIATGGALDDFLPVLLVFEDDGVFLAGLLPCDLGDCGPKAFVGVWDRALGVLG